MDITSPEHRPLVDIAGVRRWRGAAAVALVRQVVLPALALVTAFAAGACWTAASSGADAGRGVRTSAEGAHLHSKVRFRNHLVFEEHFDIFDLTRWKHEITMAGGGNWEFQWYTNNRTNSFVKDGVLHFHPTLTSTQFGTETVEEGGTLDIWGTTPASLCTSNAFYGCSRTSGEGGNVINPVQSAKVRTYESFAFKYGRLEVSAKLPRGEWLWPAIWLLPKHEQYGQWPASGEIDLMESRGNANLSVGGSATMGCTLHWGPSQQENPWDIFHAEYSLTDGTDFADDFHIFGLYWDEDEIYTYVDTDDNVVMRADINESFWTKGLRQRPHWTASYENPWRASPNVNAPYDQEFYIVMNLAVGGVNGYFNESKLPLPWRQDDERMIRHAVDDFWKARDTWYPTWKGEDSDMRIDWIRVWQDTPAA